MIYSTENKKKRKINLTKFNTYINILFFGVCVCLHDSKYIYMSISSSPFYNKVKEREKKMEVLQIVKTIV